MTNGGDSLKACVLHLINSFEQGGTERQTVQLARTLKEGGRFDVRLACMNAHGVLRAEAETLGLGEIRQYKLTSFRDASFPRQALRLARWLRENRVAVVHSHDFYTNVFGMTAARLAGVRARVASRRDIAGFRTPTENFVERCAFRVAHRVVANSDAVRSFLVQSGVPDGKIVTIYNGLDASRVEPPRGFSRASSLCELGLPGDRPLVTIVANVQNEVKDHRTFLRAARRVKDAVPEAAFVVAGEGDLLEELRAYAAQLGLGGDVFFTGRCQRVAELLAASTVCVLSSRAEGFSNSILEYMAAARPVVATDVGGAREAIEEGGSGYIVRPGDDGAMAAHVVSLLRDDALARSMGERGRAVVEEKFSSAAQLARTEEMYERLLSRSPSHAPRGVEGVRSESA